MTKIMPIGGPRIPIDFFEFEQADFIMLGKVLAFVLFIIFTQWLLDEVLKKGTPFYSKDDKKSPIYHIVIATVVSMMLFAFGWSMELIKGTAFLMILMCASASDIQTHEVKDHISVMLVLTGLIGVTLTDLPLMLMAGLIVFTFLLVCAVISKNKLGGADVKLCGACAFILGFQRSIAGLIIGLFLSVICNLIINRKSKTKDKAFPLVPYLSVGFMLMYFF